MNSFLGVDVGTSSTKGVAVANDGTILAQAVREHEVQRPTGGVVEMDGSIWWDEFTSIATELHGAVGGDFAAVGVSGMGPCIQLTDAEDRPVTPSALYGVDTRSIDQIRMLNDKFGPDEIFQQCDSYLSTQAGGPKLLWFQQERPDAYRAARRFHMPASLIVANLTGEYVLDRQSASQVTPLYDAATQEWNREWVEAIAPGIELPRLAWAGEVAGEIGMQGPGAMIPGLRPGTPVIVGTIDAWAEGLSVGAVRNGDLMLMYGTTMFLISNANQRVRHPSMWGTTSITQGQWNLAGGMATSGAITSWLRDLFGKPSYEDLVAEAEGSGPGARGLVMLPYFEGERTPIQDPMARGTIVGLTIRHQRGDLYRAALEATAFGVRHNIDVLRDSGVCLERVIAVGGGAKSLLWPQIVSDVTGLPQLIREKSIGASFGDAFLAARVLQPGINIEDWNPTTVEVSPHKHSVYEDHYSIYRKLYTATSDLQHALAREQIAPS